MAVKRMFDRDLKSFRNFRDEVLILSKLRHPNLILFMGYCFTPELCIVSEYMSKGCLFNIIKKDKASLENKGFIAKVLISVARGMTYLHSRSPPILHLVLLNCHLYLIKCVSKRI